ncbi:MAG: hypothetical protein R2753_13125 [Chitinophagales bacterium]
MKRLFLILELKTYLEYEEKYFLDNNLEQRFNKDGYVTLSLLNEVRLKELFQLLNELQSGTDKNNVKIKASYELSFLIKMRTTREWLWRGLSIF